VVEHEAARTRVEGAILGGGAASRGGDGQGVVRDRGLGRLGLSDRRLSRCDLGQPSRRAPAQAGGRLSFSAGPAADPGAWAALDSMKHRHGK
jgi:hypothetical protein